MWFVYILLCRDGSYYIGSTNNVEKRLRNHLNGKGGRYARSHKARKLVYQEKFPTKPEALKREAQLKKWPKVKKEALVKKD
jgi:putative endonuclease